MSELNDTNIELWISLELLLEEQDNRDFAKQIFASKDDRNAYIFFVASLPEKFSEEEQVNALNEFHVSLYALARAQYKKLGGEAKEIQFLSVMGKMLAHYELEDKLSERERQALLSHLAGKSAEPLSFSSALLGFYLILKLASRAFPEFNSGFAVLEQKR